MQLTFLGATGTVTGSKYLVRTETQRVLVDCGLFQGLKYLRLRNWAPLPVDAASIDSVVLTHAHIDHSGYLPLLVKQGFTGKVHCSHATRDLCGILLRDAAHLQEAEAEYANRHHFSKHEPALPLYTREDAEQALSMLVSHAYDQDIELGEDLTFRLIPAGHILGASMVRLSHAGKILLFSGDLGRMRDQVMIAPRRVDQADYLVLESTYGDRRHDPADPTIKLAEVIRRTAARGGAVIIPVFSVGRAQAILYYLHQLRISQTIPYLPVYLDSPMAAEATRIFQQHPGEHRLTRGQCEAMCKTARVVTNVDESKQLTAQSGPMVILAGSGMATGGRVVHHIKSFAPDHRNTILFCGFQAAGTRGAAMLGGAESVKIHGEYVSIKADVELLSNLSAHADYTEIMDWLGSFVRPPNTVFITHGEPVAADALRHHIEEQKHWRCLVPDYLQTIELQ
ncbi:MBL fold metallo-hydrolase [Chitinivorax sp. B]|uniref:MBL fold metallo-hydrolase n=1 Tax=Chitinivorax sp. B TaxID=2502235 RepID=UPI0010F8D5BC|nr:MBL fold metallo-hydrolase [Chitinivorax sp. B]